MSGNGPRDAETSSVALEQVIADACLNEDAGEALVRDPRAFLEARGVSAEDVEAILAAPHHLAVYRSLVRNGIGRVIVRMMSRTRARMNTACAGRFDVDVARFLDEVGPRTHYLRNVPEEFFAWAEPRWRDDSSVPAYLACLAAHELACFAVAAADERHETLDEVALDRPIAVASSVRLVRYAWAVHELPADERATDEPPRRDVRLLAYRDAGHAVRWLELTPLAGSIVDRLSEGETLRSAVALACAAHDTIPSAVAPEIARLLADFSERGVLLGARKA